MAITLVGGAAASLSSALSSVAITMPTVANGDVGYLWYAGANLAVPVMPGGWTSLFALNAGNLDYYLLRKVLTSADSATTITVTATTTNRMSLLCDVFRGVDTTTPEQVTPVQFGENTTATTRTNPTTTATAATVAWAALSSRGNVGLTDAAPPAGWTRTRQSFGAGTGATAVAGSYKTVAAGSVGGDVWTLTGTADLRGATAIVLLNPIAVVVAAPTDVTVSDAAMRFFGGGSPGTKSRIDAEYAYYNTPGVSINDARWAAHSAVPKSTSDGERVFYPPAPTATSSLQESKREYWRTH